MEISNVLWKSFDKHTSNLDPAGVHIFKIQINKWFKQIENSYVSVLSEKEVQKAKRFKNPLHQQSYLVRKYILRSLLARVLSIKPSEIEYTKIGNKKPGLPDIEFNATHSQNFAFIALSPSAIGIDVEFKDEGFDFEPLLSHCFNHDEGVFINQGDAHFNFYTLWTRKEALLKASAEGLIDDLKQVDSLIDNVTRKEKDYLLHTVTVQQTYLLSIASVASIDKIQFWTY